MPGTHGSDVPHLQVVDVQIFEVGRTQWSFESHLQIPASQNPAQVIPEHASRAAKWYNKLSSKI